jgi:flagellar M-ring protein FliF
VERFISALRSFGIGKLAAILGVSAGVAAALAVVMFNFGSSPKGLLYSNLDLKEASEITAALDQAGIKYEAKGDGSTIMVQQDKVASTRLMLSGKGLPTAGSVGYEIFDQTNALGQTDFVQNLNRQRALEGELARTIKALKGVNFARVQLVLPKRQLFEEEAEAPSASIVIGSTSVFAGSQVQALQNLVAGAVPGLKADRVTIVDQSGRLLAGGDGDGAAGAMAVERRNQAEQDIERKVRALVEGVVGAGKARVNVTADLDLSRVTTQEEKFDPDGQVVRSTQTSEENAQEGEQGGADTVTAANNLPNTQPSAGAGMTSSNSGRTEETTNYEISKTVRTEVIEPGAVKRLSIAVAVDGVTAPGVDGKPGAYTPRSAEDMQRIEQLVRSAIGFNQERGDQVSVVNVRFNRDAINGGVEAKGGLLANFDKNDIMRAAEMGILLVVAALIIFFVARPLLKTVGGGVPGVMAMPMMAAAGAGANALTGPGGATPQLAGDGASGAPQLTGPPDEGRIDIARIEGQVKASAVKQVSDFVDRHPDESVSILRSWLHEA